MRYAWLVGILGLVGCDEVPAVGTGDIYDDPHDYDYAGSPTLDDDAFLRWDNGLWGYEIHGVELSGPEWGVAGMSGFTCQYLVTQGSTGTDVDVTPRNDEVEDGAIICEPGSGGADGGCSHVVLVGDSGDDVHLVDMPSGNIGLPIHIQGRVESRLAGDDAIVSTVVGEQSCSLQWNAAVDGAVVRQLAIPEAYCVNYDVEVGADGTVWLASGDTVGVASAEGFVEIAIPADELALDALGAYVGERRGDTITAIAPDGTIRWTTGIAAIVDLEARAGAGQIVVSGERDGGDNTEVYLIDATTGAIVDQTGIRRDPAHVALTPEGDALALWSRDQIDVFEIAQ